MPATNPYKLVGGQTEGASKAAGPVYDERAVGLDGETLDALLRHRFTEGVEVGRREAWGQAFEKIRESSAFAWDRGHASGVDAMSKLATDEATIAQNAFDEIEKLVVSSQMARETKEVIGSLLLLVDQRFATIVRAEGVRA